jgi:hypothetical protein
LDCAPGSPQGLIHFPDVDQASSIGLCAGLRSHGPTAAGRLCRGGRRN